ncbi:preprotein translocase subunit SecB [Vibrio campbellii]|uniref:protein-export chaperone SecB n=1 Tax=Vibrio campbellii TaxID=680 RepID=UPI000EFB3267|nr:protein-export chaperone SecB [Vibrio campbellii]AYO07956.1 preprotein translocase subunit SecB [Vibrio campbellii]
MKLKLKSTIARKLVLIPSNEVADFENKEDFGFGFSPAFPESESNTFMVIFEAKIKVENTHLLEITYDALFETDEDVNDKFKESCFPEVNAPAIAFPYMRAFISTFLLNAGYEPIMLPSINFSALYNDR